MAWPRLDAAFRIRSQWAMPEGGPEMTDTQRVTTRESSYVDPVDPAAAGSVRVTESSTTPAGPSGATTATRIVTFAFGLLQALLILRIILLVLVANPGNDIVAAILAVTDPFVEPFRGMFALDRVKADQGSVLDIAAIVALIGWTLIEALILALIRIFSRRETVTA
jgi:uncharacterized protein YggT (Ycf19 family)